MASSNFPFGTAVTTGEANFSAAAAGDTPLIVSANAAQTADVVDVTNSTGATKYLAITSAGNVTTSGNVSVGGTLTATGASTLTGNVTLTGSLSVGTTLAVTGATTLTGALTVTAITGPTTLTGALTVTGAAVIGNATGTVGHTVGFDGSSGQYGLKLVDIGAGASVTPGKFLRNNHANGNFEVVNNAYSATIFSIPDSITAAGYGPVMKLWSGAQETGFTGIHFPATVGGTTYNIMQNFRQKMTTLPSGITLTVTLQSNNGTSLANQITVDGFQFFTSPVAGSDFYWLGTYTTVGN